MYPHIRFAAFLQAKKKDLKNIKNLPVPTPEEIAAVFPNIKSTKKWYAFSKTDELRQKTPEARLAYSLWANQATRIFMYVAFLRHLDNTAHIIKQHFCIDVNEKVIELFKTIFFDVEKWDRIDLEIYSQKLGGVDRDVFETCLSTAETESILTSLGIKLNEFDHESYLHNMFFMAYDKFMREPDLAWGKFAVSLEKRISEMTQSTKKDILKELNLELDGLRAAAVVDFEDLDEQDP